MLYIISNHKGQVKIGISKHPEKRLKQLQTGNPHPLKLEGVFHVEDYYEKRLHYLLRNFKARHKGEWFNISVKNMFELLDEVLPF